MSDIATPTRSAASLRPQINAGPGDSALAERLKRELQGDVLFDRFSRGRYSTDASIYQVEPVGVVIPKTDADLIRAAEIAIDAGVPLLPRGGGTSQCGQTVNEALVLDCSKHLNGIVDFDAEAMSVTVEPGIVLDHLNAFLKPHGLWYPIDVSTSSRATIGGMTANNSCGARSIRYGIMRDNVTAIDALLTTGETAQFAAVPGNLGDWGASPRELDLVQRMRAIAEREKSELAEKFPDLMRRVGGYNLDSIDPAGHNMAELLVGSEGTLATFRRIKLKLHRIPPQKVMGVCHFPTFYQAMQATKHIVELDPDGVELVDRTMIELARNIPIFRPMIERFVKGEPDALLLVEFAGEDHAVQVEKLGRLIELMGDLGFPDAVVEAIDPSLQADIGEVRRQGLNIMMSMKTEGKPVSFIEDCAVQLDDLAEYTRRLTEVFERHGTNGTWYAHASVGTLHVRPVLNMKQGEDVRKMREIAEEAFAMVREYKGSHSGEHGDGIVRSEFHEPMFGTRLVNAFGDVKRAFDPAGLMNPGRIVDPPKMDDRTLFRFKPDYDATFPDTVLDWSEWRDFAGAIEMCNNNGACRKRDASVMCPSFRATGDEKHLTRGRANALRMAISGQLGEDAFTSPEMAEAMALCVSCKGCKRECPTGVDMARMKIEFLHHYKKRHGFTLKDKLIAGLPYYAEAASRFHFLVNLRDQIPGAAQLSEWITGFSAKRSLPKWSGEPFQADEAAVKAEDAAEEAAEEADVVLLADTFNAHFEPETLRAALAVLEAAGKRVHVVDPKGGGTRPLCCGRPMLAVGKVEEAREAARAMLAAFKPFVDRGIPIVGLEPSCLFTFRDEYKAMLPGEETDKLAEHALLFEEYLARESAADRLKLDLKPIAGKALLHGHCHQKAFAVMGSVEAALKLIPELEVEVIKSSCCGMAGSFGYEAETVEVSMAMAEADLLPAVRAAGPDDIIVADGTSCRHQIADGAARQAVHVACVLERALAHS